mgnify:CR=1 FL=1
MKSIRSRSRCATRRLRRAAGLLLALALVAGACGSPGAGALPELELESLDGGTIDLAAERDTPLVLNLWATWCAPCRRELPAFDQVSSATAGDVTIIGVNQGDDLDAAGAMIDELGIDFPQAVDSSSELSRELAITSMPSTVFVSASGEVVETHAGELNVDQLTALIEDHLGVTTAPA